MKHRGTDSFDCGSDEDEKKGILQVVMNNNVSYALLEYFTLWITIYPI